MHLILQELIIKRYTKSTGAFLTMDAALKVLYLSTHEV
jgi:hypothetical protein